MHQQYETYLIQEVLPMLEKGRPNWDKPHTQHVVEYAKAIAMHENLSDRETVIQIITAYLHDYGYIFFRDQLQSGPTVGKAKHEHAEKSAQYWDTIRDLPPFDFLSVQDKDRITHLIRVHDNLPLLQEKDELLFMEADTLGSLKMGKESSLDEAVYQSYISRTRANRIARFISTFSIQEAQAILD